ncbi:MAG TPA: CARDB domain-containing protein, partial [Kiritimatiellia bacterium]|nr:CARDB domain-containing protein [Kiritimatiellia bacterium]
MTNSRAYRILAMAAGFCLLAAAAQGQTPGWMKPDFVVSSVVLDPAAPSAGSDFTATVTIVNQGDIPGDAGVVRLWASKSKTAKAGEAGDAEQVLGLLEVGETRVLTFTLTAPDESGTFHARAFVDADGAIKEKSDGNNQLTAVYTIDAPPTWMKPDFVVESLELIPAAPPAGGTFFATASIVNQGDIPGDAGVVRMWASKPGNAQAGEAGDAEQAAGILNVGETRTLTFSLTASTKPGTRHVRAFVDADDGTAEKSDGNNQLTVTYTVDPTG